MNSLETKGRQARPGMRQQQETHRRPQVVVEADTELHTLSPHGSQDSTWVRKVRNIIPIILYWYISVQLMSTLLPW